MSFALLLIAASDQQLSTAHIAHIEALCDELSIPLTDRAPVWLSSHRAAEFYIDDQLSSDQRDKIRLYTDQHKIDIFCIAEENRRKHLLLADMDSTIIEGETLDEIAVEAGFGPQVKAITTRAMNGELNFEESLEARIALLKGQDETLLTAVKDQMVLNPGAEIVVKTMAKYGASCVLVSGGFTYYTEHIARLCGFAYHHGNILDIENGKLTGTVTHPILGREAKEEYLNRYVEKLNIYKEDSITVGDGANDLAMLSAAGLGIGYYPKPALEEALAYHIKHTDLTSLLFIQGYQDNQFVI